MKHVQACLSGREERESSSLHCVGLVRLVKACLCTGKPDKAVLTSQCNSIYCLVRGWLKYSQYKFDRQTYRLYRLTEKCMNIYLYSSLVPMLLPMPKSGERAWTI